MMTNKSPLIRISRALVSGLMAMCCWGAQAQVPDTINYQGMLTSPSGTPISGSRTMVFSLYTVATLGSAIYTETQTVTVNNGVFNVAIGSMTPLALPFDVPYFLGVAVGTDAEMTPRQALLASPYARRAADSDFSGNLNLQESTTASVGNIMKGGTRFIHNYGSGNTFIGESAGNFTMTGGDNTGSGSLALFSNISGNFNTAVGYGALDTHTSGDANVAVGTFAMAANMTGTHNVPSATMPAPAFMRVISTSTLRISEPT